jgi:hypothetical protein
MKGKMNENTLPPAYEGVERQLTALFYCGVYITNADMVEIGKRMGLDLPLKDRISLLKQLMRHAHDHDMKPQMMQGFVRLLQERMKTYQTLAQNYPSAAPLIGEWIQKARATVLLLQREMRSHPYE